MWTKANLEPLVLAVLFVALCVALACSPRPRGDLVGGIQRHYDVQNGIVCYTNRSGSSISCVRMSP